MLGHRRRTGPVPLPALLPRAPLGFGQTGDGVVADLRGPCGGPQLACRDTQGPGGRRRGRQGWADVRRAGRRVARRRPLGRRRPSARQKGVRRFADHAGRIRALAALCADARVRRSARRRHRRSRMANMGRPAEPRGTLPVPDCEPPGGCPRDLRLGEPTHPPPGRAEPARRDRAAAERREAAHEGCRRRGGRRPHCCLGSR